LVGNLADLFSAFFTFAAGYERLARARLGLPEVKDASAETKDIQAPSSVLEMDQPSSVLEIDLGASTGNISTAAATFDDDDSNLDMFGDDDNDDAKHSSDANTAGSGSNPGPPQGTLGSSGVESKFSSVALFLFFCGKLFHICPLLSHKCYFFKKLGNLVPCVLQKLKMDAWSRTMSMILLQGRL
jgi:hypothetical protein